jgi:hypothetical protein
LSRCRAATVSRPRPPFGDDAQAEVVSQLDLRLHEDVVARVADHVRDERPVDLDLVDGEHLQMGHRRVAGAEVVDRRTYAQVVDLTQDVDRHVGVGHHGVLGDLHAQQASRDIRAYERFGHPAREPGVERGTG